MGGDDLALPIRKLDRPKMFRPGSVLRECTEPVFPIAVDLEAADLLGLPSCSPGNLADRPWAAIDDQWVPLVEEDPEPPYAPRRGGQHPVTEVHPEEIGVRAADVSGVHAQGDVRRRSAAFDIEDLWDWCGGWDSNPHVL